MNSGLHVYVVKHFTGWVIPRPFYNISICNEIYPSTPFGHREALWLTCRKYLRDIKFYNQPLILLLVKMEGGIMGFQNRFQKYFLFLKSFKIGTVNGMHLWCRMFEWLSSFSSQRTVRHIIVSIPTHRWENWGPELGDWQLTAGTLVGRLT